MIDWTKLKTKEIRLEEEKTSLMENLRAQRNKELRDTDYLLLSDAPITESERNEALAYRQSLRDLTDNVATASDYQTDHLYASGDTFIYNGGAYVVITGHTSQLDWVPSDLPAIYRYLGEAELLREPDVVPVWIQPTGAHDAYQIGDRVMHNDVMYESNSADNVWEPGVFGWVVV